MAAEMPTLKPVFPLPKGYFGAADLPKEQQARCSDIVRMRLARALADEFEFVRADHRQVNTAKWRLVKKRRELRIYRRTTNTVTSDEDTNRPSMLSVGRMEGTLEDVLYGSYDKTHEELQATMAIVDPSAKDCTVLHTLELATPTDPFHYVGIKWLLTPLPASAFLRPRDWCYIEALGIEHDASGNRFGYQILHSVDLPHCPAFDRRTVVRGKLQLSFIFREPVPGVVEVFAQGLFDPAGEIIQAFTTVMQTYALTAIFKNVACAEAKKLTVLALRNMAAGKRPFDDVQQYCLMCRSTGSMFSSLRTCRVCGITVCSQCRVKKAIFIGPARAARTVTCCRRCIKEATTLDIRPAEPSFSILGEQHLPPDGPWSNSNSDGPPEERTPLSDEHVDNFADDLSELDVDNYRFSNDSGYSEDEVEKVIASMAAAPPPQDTAPAPVPTSVAAAAADEEEKQDPGELVNGETLSREQSAIYQKILALQTAANDAYSLTLANTERMTYLR